MLTHWSYVFLALTHGHENAFSIIGHLWGESTSHYWWPTQMVQRCSGFPAPVMQSSDAFFEVSLNTLLNKQLRCWWFWMPWRLRDVPVIMWYSSDKSNTSIRLGTYKRYLILYSYCEYFGENKLCYNHNKQAAISLEFFAIIIHIWLKFCFTVIPFLAVILLQTFCTYPDMQLGSHV